MSNTEKPKSQSPPREQSTTAKKTSSTQTATSVTKTAKEDNGIFQKIKNNLGGLGSKIKSGRKTARRFLAKHWKTIVAGGIAFGLAAAEEKMRNSVSGSDSDDFSNDDDDNRINYSIPDDEELSEFENDLEEDDTIDDETSRSPMTPHLRRGHPHRYKTKNGFITHMLNDIGVNGFDVESDNSDEEDNEE